MKRIIFAALALFVAVGAFAQERMVIPESYLRYEANEDYTEVTITGFNYDSLRDTKFEGKIIEIPASIQGVPVTEIRGNNGYYHDDDPQGSTIAHYDEKGAFEYGYQSHIPKFEGIYIPDSVKRIGQGAFLRCSFKTVRLSENLSALECGTFQDSNLISITIPQSVERIEKFAFYGCRNLKEVTIQPGTKTIGKLSFKGCTSLESLTIPKSVTEIEGAAFYGAGIKKLVLSKGRVFFGQDAFKDCNQLEEIEIPEGFVALGWYQGTLADIISGSKIDASFALQKKLKSVKMLERWKVFSDEAFAEYKAALDAGEHDTAVQIADDFLEQIGQFNTYRREWNTNREKAYEAKYDAAFAAGKYEEAAQIAQEHLHSYENRNKRDNALLEPLLPSLVQELLAVRKVDKEKSGSLSFSIRIKQAHSYDSEKPRIYTYYGENIFYVQTDDGKTLGIDKTYFVQRFNELTGENYALHVGGYENDDTLVRSATEKEKAEIAAQEAAAEKEKREKAIEEAFKDGSTEAVSHRDLAEIPAPATLTFSITRGKGKSAETLTVSVPVEWNKDELKRLGL